MTKIFYPIILTIFITLYKRFIIPSSFVSGTANIYLTPKIYWVDLLLVGLLFLEIISFFRLGFNVIRVRKFLKENLFLILFLGALLNAVVLSSSPIFSFYSFLRLVSFLPLFFFVSYHEPNYRKSFRFLTVPIIIVSILALLQWQRQHFIFGFFPFGEALFSSSSANAPLVNYFGYLRLRAFGTFPHPNVLGGFLALSLLAVASSLKMVLTRIERAYFLVVFFLGLAALYFSFSQGAWAAFILGLGLLFLWSAARSKTSTRKILLTLLTFLVGALIFWTIYKLPLETANSRRQDLIAEALRLFKEYPFSGVGLGNFVKFSHYYWKEPVHNIYLLLLSETGIFGLTAFLLLTTSSLNRAVRHYSASPLPFILLVQFLFLGLFDHYLFTSITGLFLFWLTLGFSWRRPNPDL